MNSEPQEPPPSPTAFRRREFLAKLTRPIIGGGILIGGDLLTERVMASGCTECDTYANTCATQNANDNETCGTDTCSGWNWCKTDTCLVNNTCNTPSTSYDECAVTNTCQQSNTCAYAYCTSPNDTGGNSMYCNGQNQCTGMDNCDLINVCNTNVCSGVDECSQTNQCTTYNSCTGTHVAPCLVSDVCYGTNI